MLAILSPAKSLNLQASTQKLTGLEWTQPVFAKEANQLARVLKSLSRQEIKQLMSVSDNLADINYQRYQNWCFDGVADKLTALLMFQGDVYQGLNAVDFNDQDMHYCQQYLRILSGLYGLLSPLDLVQPYRLEMGTKLSNPKGTDLYDYWQGKISSHLNQIFSNQSNPVLLNLASNEYFKAIDANRLEADIITPVFLDYKNGVYKVISFYAKKARGLMARYLVKNKLSQAEQLKDFDYQGYSFCAQESDAKRLVFKRNLQAV